MSIRRGRILGRGCQLTGEGRETRPAYPAGRIYEVDPQAVARLRAMMAQGAKPPARMERATVETETIYDVLDLQALHGRYMAGESIKVLAAEAGVSWQSLLGKFKEAGMPRRAAIERAGEAVAPPTGKRAYERPLATAVALNGAGSHAALAREMVAELVDAPLPEPTPTPLPANIAAFLADMRALGGVVEVSGVVDVHIKIRF